MIEDNTSGDDSLTNMDNSSSLTIDSSSSSVSQSASEYKRKILAYAYLLLSAIEDDDYNGQQRIESEAGKYNMEMKSGILHDELWNDSKFTSEAAAISKKLDEVINEALINGKNVYSMGVTWLWKWEYNSSTTNSGF